MDSINYCVLCNPEKNWLELEFMSENDEPINGLDVTIQLNNAADSHTGKTSGGKVIFGEISAGEWRISVNLETLLSQVEQYASREEGTESPVKTRSNIELDAMELSSKVYKLVTIGDLWNMPPEEDIFLMEYHKGLDINVYEYS